MWASADIQSLLQIQGNNQSKSPIHGKTTEKLHKMEKIFRGNFTICWQESDADGILGGGNFSSEFKNETETENKTRKPPKEGKREREKERKIKVFLFR